MKLFTCNHCKEEVDAATNPFWSDEEAIERFKTNFPDYPFMEATVLCSDCFQLLIKGEQQ